MQVDHRRLFERLERTLDKIENAPELSSTLTAILARLVEDFREDLGLVGGRLYSIRGGDLVLAAAYPPESAPVGFRVPGSYAPVRELLRDGFVCRSLDDPGIDSELEQRLGGRSFAAICAGEACRHVIAFSLDTEADNQQVRYMLNTVRHAINLKLRRDELEDTVAQARVIQQSLLPDRPPEFPGFDIWGASVAADEVGGDLYDFIEVSRRSLGLAVADASGHGLPAALQARDAIIGLRMGVEERWRITATVEKLNRVISRTALASKFISLFYAELETNGTLVYCNAGHVPPVLWNAGRFEPLSQGGLILGPDPDALYQRGYAHLAPGAVLLAVTDGILEAESAAGDGEMFDRARLRDLVTGRTWTEARALVEAVFEEVRAYSGVSRPTDDQTVVAVIRTK